MKNRQFFTRCFTGIALLGYLFIMATSCGNVKNLQYVQGSFDTARLSQVKIPEPVIQKGDLLSINIYSDDPAATAAVTTQANTSPLANNNNNMPLGSGGGSAVVNNGYVVNQSGNIQLFKLGIIHAEGLTKYQLADTLIGRYIAADLLKNPYVEVRFLNFKVTLIGEVNRPGTYTIPSDQLSAFEAIGLAGDITAYGRRDNVLVVRESNGVRQLGRLNVGDPNVFLSPYYYLQQNDLVIVDVSKNKSAVNSQNTIQIISISATVLSALAVIYTIFFRR